jgi:hypothetical protein
LVVWTGRFIGRLGLSGILSGSAKYHAVAGEDNQVVYLTGMEGVEGALAQGLGATALDTG